VEVLIEGLEVWGRHGVLAEEKTLAQCFRIDLRLTLHQCAGAHTDDLADTVDYAAVVETVAAIVEKRSYALLERLAQVLAETVLAAFDPDAVWVRVAKPGAPIARPLGAVAVSLELHRANAG
jgi:dihydroneopterin aldolase